MEEIIFNFEDKKTILMFNKQDKLKDIFKNYALKIGKDITNLYFSYKGNEINDKLTVAQLFADEYEKLNKNNIFVKDKNKSILIENIIYKKDIICPQCYDIYGIKFQNNKLKCECKNGHEINEILINDFENLQKKCLSKIICNNCKNKKDINDNEFYKCYFCNANICKLCKSNHDKTHNIIYFDKKTIYAIFIINI